MSGHGLSDGTVLSVHPCTPRKEKGDHILDVSIDRFDAADSGSRREELGRFAEAYPPVGMEETGCEE